MSQPRFIPTKYLLPALFISVCLSYYFSNPLSGSYYDYTLRIAYALLQGQLGQSEEPPSWLSEMIPLNGKYYSAFPLGSVLSMLPLAVLKQLHLIEEFPGVIIAALLAGASALLFFLLSAKYSNAFPRRLVLTLFPVLGTWMWANLAFGGAWHIALGIAIVGQLGALYFTLIKNKPFYAGLFFALAFGNRTEIILLAPLFLYLIYRNADLRTNKLAAFVRPASCFLVIPLLLGIATLVYNYARFASPFDFGYARIPGVLDEPWYKHGIFSLYAIPLNAKEMLLTPWKSVAYYPYLVPTGFGGSIFLNSPYLIFLFRKGAHDVALKLLAWGAIVILTFVLWCHGNPGGWQFSYRYAIELLPWVFLILLENSPAKISKFEITLFLFSLAINAYGTYLFLRTNYI